MYNLYVIVLFVSVIVPHIGSDTYDAREGMSEIAAKNILAVLEGTDMVYEL